ncbi:MAG: transketolase, partial [Rhizobiales bacterium]|nr:transketolase [Hyphomicrobiales bacterium]
ALHWPHGPFDIPDAVRAEWLKAGHRGAQAHSDWEHHRSSLDDDAAWTFADHLEERLTDQASKALDDLAHAYLKECPAIASRQASEIVIDAVTKAQSNIIGGSADLTHSNLTKGKSQKPITPDDFTGSYLHFGVREHGMGAALNGLSLHGGFKTYGGTFLVFADYARPAIRLSALMRQPVIYVMTHDSIGLGEDGPTHQPVEHLASLRAMPNLLVFRPADARETVEAWRCALQQASRPSVLCLSRQALPPLPEGEHVASGVAAGAYVVSGWAGVRDVTLLATGSEVGVALKAAADLAERGVMATVVSMPCWELFREQPDDYRARVLGTAPCIAVEAACATGWHEWIGRDGGFVGMRGFGASAPAAQLYEHFNITPRAVVAKALNAIGADA